MRRLALALAAWLALAPAPPPAWAQEGVRAITVDARPIASFGRAEGQRFGQLRFLGGLHLTSRDRDFGGLSGLRLDAAGERLTAVTDRGFWLRARIDYAQGRPSGISDAMLAPILGSTGRPVARTRDGDTESLEIAGQTAYVANETANRLFRFDLSKWPSAPAQPVAVPRAVSGLPRNAGLEAIALVPKGLPAAGALLGIAEEGSRGRHPAWLIAPEKGAAAMTGELAVRERDGFAVTDAVFLPGAGDLLILERRYRPPFSLSMRLRRIVGTSIVPGAMLDGEVMMEAALGEEIDNMEGLAAHRTADGRIVLTLISDDNFSYFQRTLLLQFEVLR